MIFGHDLIEARADLRALQRDLSAFEKRLAEVEASVQKLRSLVRRASEWALIILILAANLGVNQTIEIVVRIATRLIGG